MKRSLIASSLLLVGASLAAAAIVQSNTVEGASSHAVPNCQNIQLNSQYQSSNGATGHIGVIYRFQNLTGRACSLTGYPGVQLLDNQFHSLPTTVHRGPGGIVGAPAQRTVTLQPHGRAFFALGYSDVPSGNGPCPTARYLMITPPNDYLPVVGYAFGKGGITACNGTLYVTPVTVNPTLG